MGAVAIVEGYKDKALDAGYAYTMISTGVASAAATILIFAGVAVPVAVVLLVVAAVVGAVVAWFKPSETQRWLDKVMHFGNNSSGAYRGLEEQCRALKTLQQV